MDAIEEIKKKFEQGATRGELANQYGLTYWQIHHYVRYVRKTVGSSDQVRQELKKTQDEIRSRRAAGESVVSLMGDYGLSYARIYQILNPEAHKGQMQRRSAREAKAREKAKARAEKIEAKKIAAIIAKGLDA